MGAGALRVAPNGVRAGSVVRTLKLLHNDPMSTVELNPKGAGPICLPRPAADQC